LRPFSWVIFDCGFNRSGTVTPAGRLLIRVDLTLAAGGLDYINGNGAISDGCGPRALQCLQEDCPALTFGVRSINGRPLGNNFHNDKL
jgi:hypothetical protein